MMELSIDREKVIKGLEICTKDIPMTNAVHKSDFCKECPYYNAENRYCWNQIVMMRDALALLKEKEVVEPKQVDLYGKDDWYGLVCVCPDCKAEWMSDKDDTHFCPNCGGRVKWNE